MIRAVGLVRSFRRGSEIVEALKGISLEVGSGESVVLFGPSGAGKTTTLNIIGGMDLPDHGRVEVLGRDLGRCDLVDFRRHHVGFIFSDFFLIPTLTALENVALPTLWTGRGDTRRARELLAMVGLESRAGHYPGELSGGELQRVAIARALVNRPQLLIADEPTANLDTKTRDQVMELFESVNREQEITLVMATHDRDLLSHAHRTIRLEDGRVVDA